MASASARLHSAGNRSSPGCEGGGEGALPTAAQSSSSANSPFSPLSFVFFSFKEREMENNLALSRQRACPAQPCTERLLSWLYGGHI